MYDTRLFYRAQCEQCFTCCDGYESNYWESPESADIIAEASEWHLWRDQNDTMHHLCDQCAKEKKHHE